MKNFVIKSVLAGALVFSAPVYAEHSDHGASAQDIATAMATLDGRWVGSELKRKGVFEGAWTDEPAAFNFSFDAETQSGQTLNDGEPPFTVTAKDGELRYAGEIRGKMMEQTRRIVDLVPMNDTGNMTLVAEYEIPAASGVVLTVRETYQIFDGVYMRRQEFRPAGSDVPFSLLRDARFIRADDGQPAG